MSETESQEQLAFTDEQLRNQETVYHSKLFEGSTVVVSGAGSGLGKATATLFARLGADLVICGRDIEKLESVAEFYREFGSKVATHSMNIREPEQVDGFFDFIEKDCGGLDILVNNAGGQYAQPAIDFSPKGFKAVVDVNLNGTWWMMQTAARQWIKQSRPGSIINVVASIWRGMPGLGHTCAARAGVIYLSKTVAVEWAPENIRINCVVPGIVKTSSYSNYSPEARKTYDTGNPMMRAGDAWDIAQSIVYLASSSGKFITGEVLNIDGGQQMWGDPWGAGRPDYFQLNQ